MRAEIVSIGTELLVGSTINTNAAYLSARLADLGIDVYRHTVVGDNVDRIVLAFEEAAMRSELVLCTGGLGPTEDDVTAEAAARFVREPLVMHRASERHIERALKARGLRMTKLIRRQCFVPRGAVVLRNLRGTAAGWLVRTPGGSRLMALPGPPRELKSMMDDAAIPALTKHMHLAPACLVRRSVRLAGLIEVQVAAKVHDLLKLRPPVTVGIYAKAGEVELKIMAKASSEKKASEAADRIERTIRRRFGDRVYGTDSDTIGAAAGKRLAGLGKTLAVAESCTGGALANLFTDVPGSSEWFKGGIVSYVAGTKEALLGVQLGKRDPVSGAVAVELARAARERFQSDFGIGVTGNAGPGKDKGSREPVGIVFIAVADARGVRTKKSRFAGTRAEIKARAAREAANLIRTQAR